jgi:hypothetical protein
MNQESSQSQGYWLTEKELATHLNISTRHLTNLRRAGLPYVQLGSVVRYDLAEVAVYLKANRRLETTLSTRATGNRLTA